MLAEAETYNRDPETDRKTDRVKEKASKGKREREGKMKGDYMQLRTFAAMF